MLKGDSKLLQSKPPTSKLRSKPPPLSFKQKLRRKERREAELERQAQRSPLLLSESPQSSPEENFTTCITREEILQVTRDGGSVMETVDSPRLQSSGRSRRRDALAASGERAGRMTRNQETDAERFQRIGRSDLHPQSPLVRSTSKSMNKSRLTRYIEANSKSKPSLTGESFNCHDVGVNPRSRGPLGHREEPSTPTYDNRDEPDDAFSSVDKNVRLTRRMARQLEEAKGKGSSRELLIYGTISVLCLLSGRLDASAIFLRIVVIAVCALIMKSCSFIKL